MKIYALNADQFTMWFLGKVQESFDITDRGTVLVLPKEWGTGARIRIGQPIQLRTPDSRVIETRIDGIELVKSTGGSLVGVVLPRGIFRADVPIQTEIWVIEI